MKEPPGSCGLMPGVVCKTLCVASLFQLLQKDSGIDCVVQCICIEKCRGAGGRSPGDIQPHTAVGIGIAAACVLSG